MRGFVESWCLIAHFYEHYFKAEPPAEFIIYFPLFHLENILENVVCKFEVCISGKLCLIVLLKI